MSKLSLVVSQEKVLDFSTEEKFLTNSVASSVAPASDNNLNVLLDPLNPQKCSIEELLFVLKNSLSDLKSSQSRVNFLSEELLILMKKS